MADSRISRIAFSWPRPTSLAWDGDDLVDWLGGGNRWLADGTPVERARRYAYDFDRALVSPSGRYAALYCERQTKGLILEDGEIVREIDRSYYQANAYAYPVALGRLGDGREVIAHCPDAYNVLEIETLDTGERLTRRNGEAQDVFHSRLSFSPDGRLLLSAGWLWHPWNCFAVFDLDRALADPGLLDREDAPFGEVRGPAGGVKAACWLDSARILVTSDLESADDPDDEEAPCSGIWDVRKGEWASRSTAWNPQASLVRCGGGVAYVEDGHPRWWAPGMEAPLVWPDVAVVEAVGPRERYGILHDSPLLAAHPREARFAVVTEGEIVVVEVGV